MESKFRIFVVIGFFVALALSHPIIFANQEDINQTSTVRFSMSDSRAQIDNGESKTFLSSINITNWKMLHDFTIKFSSAEGVSNLSVDVDGNRCGSDKVGIISGHGEFECTNELTSNLEDTTINITIKNQGLSESANDNVTLNIIEGYFTVDSVATIEVSKLNQTDLDNLEKSINSTLEIHLPNWVWDEVLTGQTHNVQNSAGKILRELKDRAGVIFNNQKVQNATQNTITLHDGASTKDAKYQHNLITIDSGRGEGQSRYIIFYNGSERKATLNRDWNTIPNSTSRFSIFAQEEQIMTDMGEIQSATNNTITLDKMAENEDDLYKSQLIYIASGTGADQTRLIRSYNGSSRTVTVSTNWTTLPEEGSGYITLPNGEAATSIFTSDAKGDIDSILTINETVKNEHSKTRTNIIDSIFSEVWQTTSSVWSKTGEQFFSDHDGNMTQDHNNIQTDVDDHNTTMTNQHQNLTTNETSSSEIAEEVWNYIIGEGVTSGQMLNETFRWRFPLGDGGIFPW